MKTLRTIVLALFLVGWAATVFAAPPDNTGSSAGPGAPHQWAHQHHRQAGSFLNLTQEQRVKMKGGNKAAFLG